MSTALMTPNIFDLSEVLCKSNKMINYNNNILSPSSVTAASLLDRKAVGTPAMMGFPRRHSVTLPKFSQNQFLNSLKMDACPTITSASLGGNKENKFRDRSFSENGERLLQKAGGGSGGGQVNSSRYKTELCRPYEENGACKYGDKCQFAHGMHELRSLTRHPKYKTELCRTFHTIGFCPYGPRCHFIHNAEERRQVSGREQMHFSLSSGNNKLDRPRLQHSFSFAGFPSANGLLDSPTSITPPPALSADDLLNSPCVGGGSGASNPFTFSSQELANFFAPGIGLQLPLASSNVPGSPTGFLFRPMSDSPQLFDSPPSPQDSLSDQEGYLSSCSSNSGHSGHSSKSRHSGHSSHSGSDSPTLDANRRLPIFSRLSISDD